MKESREECRELAVEFTLAIRREYLASGGKALTNWDTIQSRMLSASRQSETRSEWVTLVRRGLQLGSPTQDFAKVAVKITDAEIEDWDWMDTVESDCALIMARARLEAARRKNQRVELEEEFFGLQAEDAECSS